MNPFEAYFNRQEQIECLLLNLKTLFEDVKANYQPKEAPEYLTIQEVLELLKVDGSTLHRWRKQGKLIAYGLGDRVYFKRNEIDAALIPLNELKITKKV